MKVLNFTQKNNTKKKRYFFLIIKVKNKDAIVFVTAG